MSDKLVTTSLFQRLAGWARALLSWARSLTRVDPAGFAADRLPRAEDIEFEKYGP
ncbi:MAG: hypothetical protein ACLPSW_02735 [Roseiarcus sp.]